MLAQPLIVEALEDSFVPVAIYNNVGGKDKKILDRFKEPAWNYQVMRFLDSDLKELLPRKDKVWTIHATAKRLANAIKKGGAEAPAYLQNILIPESNPDAQYAAFAMYCFWTGEAKLGSLDGVLATEAGFYDGHEVVVVKFDQEKIRLLELVAEAEKFECASGVYLPSDEQLREVKDNTRLSNVKLFDSQKGYRRAPVSDQKKQLSKLTGLNQLNLTPMQWTKLNSSRVSGDSFDQWLSPRQTAKLREMKVRE